MRFNKGPGKPLPIPGATLYVRELPSRFVIVETPQQRLVYDERGDPDQPGSRTSKSKASAAEKLAIGSVLQTVLASSGDKIKVIGKATYAGIPCDVRQFLVPGNSLCIASVRGQYVTLAEEHHHPGRAEPSRMQAKAKADVCVSARQFEPPAHVRFKPEEAQRKATQAEREADEEDDAFFEEARKRHEEE